VFVEPGVTRGNGGGDGRRFVGAHLRERAVGAQATDLVILLASELITNAIKHGPPPLCLQVIVAVDRIRWRSTIPTRRHRNRAARTTTSRTAAVYG
jgi:hypothetical protein